MDQCWKRFSEWGKGCHCEGVLHHGHEPDREENQAGRNLHGWQLPNPARANSVAEVSVSFASFLHELFAFGGRKARGEATKNMISVKPE